VQVGLDLDGVVAAGGAEELPERAARLLVDPAGAGSIAVDLAARQASWTGVNFPAAGGRAAHQH
jgi:hypothetical protein